MMKIIIEDKPKLLLQGGRVYLDITDQVDIELGSEVAPEIDEKDGAMIYDDTKEEIKEEPKTKRKPGRPKKEKKEKTKAELNRPAEEFEEKKEIDVSDFDSLVEGDILKVIVLDHEGSGIEQDEFKAQVRKVDADSVTIVAKEPITINGSEVKDALLEVELTDLGEFVELKKISK